MIYDLQKTKKYNEMKEFAKEQSTETLVCIYKMLLNSELNTEQLVSFLVVSNELEERGVIRFNEEIFDFEFVE